MAFRTQNLVEAGLAAFCLCAGLVLFRWTAELPARWRAAARFGIVAATSFCVAAFLCGIDHVSNLLSAPVSSFFRAAGILSVGALLVALAVAVLLRTSRRFSPARRRALRWTAAAAAAAPVAVAAYGFVRRNDLRFVEADLPIANLPQDLQGIRIVQLSDIHLSPLVEEADLARAVDMANEARANLAIVTGDLVTRRGDPLDACLRQLARLRSDAGTYGCMGNHEIHADAEAYTAAAGRRLGMRFLRSESQLLRFGSAVLNLAGVDYQSTVRPYLRGAEGLLVRDTTNVLLTHNPDVFPVAARQGFAALLAGHTHGGQVNFEILHPSLNVARFYTPYTYGVYRKESCSMYVTRGVGTIGIPLRVGAPPEVAVIRLCAT